MNEIPPELAQAQKELSLVPEIHLTAREHRFGLVLFEWTSLYQGDEPATPHDAAVCADGGIVRARYDASGTLRLARVADPLNPAGWSGWSGSWPAAEVAPAVIADPQGSDVFIVWVAPDGHTLHWSVSGDNGASWTPPAVAVTEPAASRITAMAGAMRGSGARDLLVFYAVDPGGPDPDDILKVTIRPPGGPWNTPAACSMAPCHAFQGLDALWCDDFLLAATGQDPADPHGHRLWTLLYGDGALFAPGTWGGLHEVELSDDDPLRFTDPSLARAGAPRLAYVARLTGDGAYSRTAITSRVPGILASVPAWTEGQPFPYEPPATTGPRLRDRPGGSTVYMIGHDRAWKSETGARYVDLSSRCAAYRYLETPTSASLTLTLDNADGALAAAGTPGSTCRPLRRGAELHIRRGVRSGGTGYTAPLPVWRIESLAWSDAAGTGTLTVTCLGWWGVLRHWRAGRVYAWDAGEATLAAMGSELLARCGLGFGCISGEGSAAMATLRPAMIVPPGRDGASVLRHLAEKAGDALRFDGEWTILYKALRDDEAAVYAVGGTGEHPLLGATFVEDTMAANLVEVYGDGDAFGQALDDDELMAVGLRRQPIGDGSYATGNEAAARADAELGQAKARREAGTLVVRPIHGLEMWDVLAVTYRRAWAGARRFRVTGIEERCDLRKGVYEQRVSVVPL